MTMEYILSTEKLTKRYGFKAAADSVDMHVKRGSIYGFVGLNGAGKTTVIRMIAGLIRKSAGGFTLFGTPDTGDIDRARRKLSAMVETPALYLNMTGEENLKVQFDILGISGDAPSLLRSAGLEKSRVPVKSYSLGMRQRLAIAMALAADPELMLLDEPTNGLDPEGIAEVREILIDLKSRKGVTILISSHILNELGRVADCFGFIDSGKLLREVDASEIAAGTGTLTVAKVSDTEKALAILEGRAEPYRQDIAVREGVSVSELVHILDAADVEVREINTVRRDLETYFLELIGGAHESV